jgi:transcriptional regulator of aromatic amino acid metabolism
MGSRLHASPWFITQSRAMRPVVRLIERSGPSHANVLISGEPGTGKSVVARALHVASPRSGRPLLTINGGRPDDLLEAELFGVAGAPAGEGVVERAGVYELADGGTLLIDEAANLPASVQARLLEALESGTFFRAGSSQARRADVRILAATSAALPAEAAAGRFSRELLLRLGTIELELPPLRARPPHDAGARPSLVDRAVAAARGPDALRSGGGPHPPRARAGERRLAMGGRDARSHPVRLPPARSTARFGVASRRRGRFCRITIAEFRLS